MQNKIIISLLSMTLFACGGGDGSPAGNAPASAEQQQQEQQESSSDPIDLGLPTQAFMTLGADIFNPKGWNHNGEIVNVTVQLADRLGRPVSDGRRVNFTAEGGSIVDHCTTTGGACSVEWKSSNRRPTRPKIATDTNDPNDPHDHPDDAVYWPNDQIGLVTITAYAEGEADFIDTNHNGLFDVGESFTSYPEPFVDFDYNSVKNDGEWLLADTDGDGGFSEANSNVFYGSSCSSAARAAGHCSNNMHIRGSIRISMSGDGLKAGLYSDASLQTSVNSISAGTVYYLLVTDQNGNMPISETTVAITTSDGFDYNGSQGLVRNSILTQVANPAVNPDPEFYSYFGMVYAIQITDNNDANTPPQQLTITITSPLDGASPAPILVPII